MSNSSIKENKMGVMPIPKLLITMALPMIVSMLVQALYNIVDSMFVARLREEALTAVSLAFPVQNLMIAVATGTGVGINALLSRSLGEKKFDTANRIAQNGIFLALASWLVFGLFGLFGSKYFFATQTTDEIIVNYGTQYTIHRHYHDCIHRYLCAGNLRATPTIHRQNGSQHDYPGGWSNYKYYL